jgi:hypothetical protein
MKLVDRLGYLQYDDDVFDESVYSILHLRVLRSIFLVYRRYYFANSLTQRTA